MSHKGNPLTEARVAGYDLNGVPTRVTEVLPLPTTSIGTTNVISTLNSRASATLAASGTFQGVGEDVSAFGRVGVSITTSNATDGVLTMEVSRDDITYGGPTRTWSDTRFAQPHMWNIVEKYFRIKYVNGTTEADDLAIQVQYSTNADVILGHQLDETLIDEVEALIVRSVGVGQDPNSIYVNEGESGVDNNNSSTTNLTAGTSLVFTGDWSNISGYAGITTLVDGTASGTVGGTLQMQFSHDGVTVHRNISVSNTDIANVNPRTLGVVAKFYRIIYTADSDLTSFDVQVMFHNAQVALVSRLDQTLQGNEDVTNIRSVLVAQSQGGTYVNIPAATSGKLKVDVPITAFGDLLVAEPRPIVQLNFPYNINPSQAQIFPGNGGAVTHANNMGNLSTSTSTDGFALLFSRDVVRFHPGQGALVRVSAIFTTGVADSEQIAGTGNALNGLFFGYDGIAFGVLLRTSGETEVRSLDVDTASSTAEDITITLDGIAVTDVTVTNSGDATITAREIASHDYSSVGEGWGGQAVGDRVDFVSFQPGSKTGTYSLSGASTAVGTFSQTIAGVLPTDTWITQTNWSEDVMDGTGLSGATLDPTKGNVYQIRYGFGVLHFYIEDSVTGDFQEVHRIMYSNANTVPALAQPSGSIWTSVINTGNTSNITLSTSFMSGFVEGILDTLGIPQTCTRLFTIGNTTSETHIFTVRNKQIYQGTINQVRLQFNTLTITSNLNDVRGNTVFRIYEDGTPETNTDYQDTNTNSSVVECDIASTGFNISNAKLVGSFIIGANQSIPVDVESLIRQVRPNGTIMITAQPSKGHASNEVGATANWKELF